MKCSTILQNKTFRSLVLASTFFTGLPSIVGAHEETFPQDAPPQRAATPNLGNGDRNGSLGGENAQQRNNPGSAVFDRNDKTSNRTNRNGGMNSFPTDRPNQDWGDNQQGGHDGGH